MDTPSIEHYNIFTKAWLEVNVVEIIFIPTDLADIHSNGCAVEKCIVVLSPEAFTAPEFLPPGSKSSHPSNTP